jgi:hypothetical protein
VRQKPALGALFALLALGFAGVAFEAIRGAGGDAGRWVIGLAAAALAVWLGTMAVRAFR